MAHIGFEAFRVEVARVSGREIRFWGFGQVLGKPLNPKPKPLKPGTLKLWWGSMGTTKGYVKVGHGKLLVSP